MEHNAVSQTILLLVLILLAAKIFGEIAERLGQPSVLGELIAGVVLGGSVLGWVDVTSAHAVGREALLLLAELGVILLLFEIGLESDLEEFLRVGPSALMVAIIGVVAPFVAGYYASIVLGLGATVAVFIGATLTATSVGITARTLTDLGQLRSSASKIILGAAVIDDVLGLIILAVISGLVTTHTISAFAIAKTTFLALAFLVGAIVIGVPVAPQMLKVVRRLKTRGMLTVAAVLFCLVLAYAAHGLGLATIVGAFAAGLVLARTEDLANIQERIKPVADIFVPIFFVILGVSVNVALFNPFNPETRGTLMLMGIMIAIAISMKLLAGLGVLRKGVNRLVVGVGMIPRGEVGLIFASIGLARQVISVSQYGAIVGVVMFTTFVTPPLLKLVLREKTTENA